MTRELVRRLDQAAEFDGGIVEPDLDSRRTSWTRVATLSRRLASVLESRGVTPGSRVALCAPNSVSLVAALQAVWRAGASAVVLPGLEHNQSRGAWTRRTVEMAVTCDTQLLVGHNQYIWALESESRRLPFSCESLDSLVEESARVEPLNALPSPGHNAVAIFQYSSGTTGGLKAVAISEEALLAQVDALMRRSLHNEIHKCLVSWLPLYHDMGLIGFTVAPLLCGRCNLVLRDPRAFVKDPLSWLKDITRYRGTGTAAPAFAYGLLARRLAAASGRDLGLDLSSLRLSLCGGELITESVYTNFCSATKRYGFDPGSFVPAYGLAEATLAVAFNSPGTPVRWAAEPFPGLRPANRMRVAVLGKALDSLRLRIVDDGGEDVVLGRVGEVYLQGQCVATELISRKGRVNALQEGWLHTGDLGYFLEDGQLVLVGRSKDLIVVAGRNLQPEALEQDIVEAGIGVRPGSCAAFPVQGDATQQVVVVIEESDDWPPERATEVVAAASLVLRTNWGIAAIVRVAPRGSILKTSSGKVRRLEMSELAGERASGPKG